MFGLDTVKLLPSGRYTHSAAAVQQTEAAWRDYEARLTQVKKVTIVRGQQALATAPAAGKILTPGQSFKARLAYDAVNLYVRYEVTS